MENERLEFLLNRYFDQALSCDEKTELERMLLESGPARELFWKLARWHALFRLWGQQEWGRRAATQAPAKARSVSKPHSPLRQWWPLAAAAAVTFALFFWTKFSPQSWNTGQSDNISGGIAVLTHTFSAVWADESAVHQSGEVLSPCVLKLKAGALQVEFSRGARVVLEGPAEFELLSDNSGALRCGKLVATVPEPAHGFSVRAPNFSIVDHGTQFGCVVPLSDSPEVHVFRGAVSLATAVGSMAARQTELHENEAVRLANAQVNTIPADLKRFLTEEQLTRLDNEKAQIRLAAWRQSSRAFSKLPGMLVHFDFENDGTEGADHMLLNRAPNAPSATNAAVIGCEWTEGRWPGKRALEFKHGSDRLRLSLPGEFLTLTLLAWVRADGTPFRENSLVMAEDQGQIGELNWYLYREGALGWGARIAPRRASEQWRHVHSGRVFRAEALGSWRLVATVFDGATVTHYFNGKAVASATTRLPTPLHLGSFEIGNWSASAQQDDPRTVSSDRVQREIIGNFFGRIDELAILSVPLAGEQIRQIYNQCRQGEQ